MSKQIDYGGVFHNYFL